MPTGNITAWYEHYKVNYLLTYDSLNNQIIFDVPEFSLAGKFKDFNINNIREIIEKMIEIQILERLYLK